MDKVFKNKAKILYFLFGIFIFAILLASLVYMTNYAHVHVYYTKANGVISINHTTQKPVTLETNRALFNYITLYHNDITLDNFKNTVFNFQTDMSAFNTLIVTFAIVSLVCFAALLICSNHSRNVYYKSNLVCGIVAPLIVFAFSIVLIIKNLLLMGTFNKNASLFNEVAMIQNSINQSKVVPFDVDMTTTVIDTESEAVKNAKDFVTSAKPCNNITYIIYAVLFIGIAVYSLVLIIYAIKRYMNCAERRNEIIRRAAENYGQ